MKKSELLASRLRQALQGCSLHNHGPVQAWVAIEQALADGSVDSQEVARSAIEACSNRIRDLLESGVSPEDPRIKKEELTRAFVQQLLVK